MICPKCGFEQPNSPECVRCGVIVSRYKGPGMSADALRPPAPPPPPPLPPPLPLSGNETVRMTFTPPVADEASTASMSEGTLYEGPSPATAGGSSQGGTVYSGPPPGAIPAPSFGVPRGDIKVGEVLNRTFSIYFANFVPFVLLAALALLPLFVVQGIVLSAKATPAAMSPLAIVSGIAAFLGALFCPYIATGAITYGVFQQLRQKDSSLGDCISQGLSALPRVLWLALLQFILVSLATLACIVPGIILAIRWAVSVPAAVTERTGATESMSRSTFLTEGFRWDVFGFLFVLGAINLVLSLLVLLASAKNSSLNLLLSGLVNLFSTGLSATGTAVLYYSLRNAKESIDVDQIASVFA